MEDICFICHDNFTADVPEVGMLCDCKGSIKVHKECRTIYKKGKVKCNVCYYVYPLSEQETIDCIKLYKLSLCDVKEQTEEICLAAVRQYGWCLKDVKEQTPEICLEAIKQNSDAILFLQ